MTFEKDAWVAGEHTHATIYTRSYAKSFDHVQSLVDEARADYPDVKDSDIRVVVFAGERRNRMLGVEFEVEQIKDGYFVVNNPEPLHN